MSRPDRPRDAAGRVPPLHVVTDDATLAASGFEARARDVLAAGGAGVALHLRGPATGGRRLWELAVALREAASGAGALLLANDRVDVARACDLDGVQLGGRSLPVSVARKLLSPGALVGASVHGADEAVGSAADFLVVGTIFPTPSHPGREGAGPRRVTGVRERTRLPVLAIGGVTPDRAREAVSAGAWGVAVVRGVWSADDPVAAAGEYLEVMEREAG